MKKNDVHTIGELTQRKKYGYVRHIDDDWNSEKDSYDSDIGKDKWDDGLSCKKVDNHDNSKHNDHDDDDDLLDPSNPLSPLNPANPANPASPLNPMNDFNQLFL